MTIPVDRFGQVVVLVRHGEAVDKAFDARRPLSAAGQARVTTMAAWLAGLGLELDGIRHSGKARAAETAQILAGSLGVDDGQVLPLAGLAPNDDVEPLALELDAGRQSLMLAGHLPHLARLASRLLAGDPERLAVRFPDAGALVLGRIRGRWHLVAFASHEVLGGE